MTLIRNSRARHLLASCTPLLVPWFAAVAQAAPPESPQAAGGALLGDSPFMNGLIVFIIVQFLARRLAYGILLLAVW